MCLRGGGDLVSLGPVDLWCRVTEWGLCTQVQSHDHMAGPCVHSRAFSLLHPSPKHHTATPLCSSHPLSPALGERVGPTWRKGSLTIGLCYPLGSLEKGCLQHWWWAPCLLCTPPKMDVDLDVVLLAYDLLLCVNIFSDFLNF